MKRRRQFLEVADRGRRIVTPGLILQMFDRGGQAASGDVAPSGAPDLSIRYGITASKKVGRAVQRNRARRRLRVLAETLLPLHGRAGCDYVLIGREATVRRPFSRLSGDLVEAVTALNAGRGARQRQPAAGRGRSRARHTGPAGGDRGANRKEGPQGR